MMPRYSVLFCDDIRQEVSGKHILIGSYTGDLIPGAMPTAFPITMLIRVENLEGPHTFAVSITTPGKGQKIDMKGEVETNPFSNTFPLIFPGIFLQVEQYGDIEVSISLDGNTPMQIGTLKVVDPATYPSQGTAL